MLLSTFPVAVCVRVSASVVSVLNFYRHNVCTIKHRNEKSTCENSFCAGGLGDPSSPT